MDAKATGGLIARRRKEKNWSQGELTERLHVTDKAVSRWETGRGLPDENPWALGRIRQKSPPFNNGGDFCSKVIHPVSNFEEIRIHFRQDMRLPKIR